MYVNPIPMIDIGKTFIFEVKVDLEELTELECAKNFLADWIKELPKEDLIKLIKCKEIKAVYPDE